jgi:hypothetical protein
MIVSAVTGFPQSSPVSNTPSATRLPLPCCTSSISALSSPFVLRHSLLEHGKDLLLNPVLVMGGIAVGLAIIHQRAQVGCINMVVSVLTNYYG